MDNSHKMTSPAAVGYLSIILGPMWSGKTSKLVELYKQFDFCRVPVLAINYAHDTRYSDSNISTHDRREIPCVKAVTLSEVSDIMNGDLTESFTSASVILINEGQFFKDALPWVLRAVEKYSKRVYISGLDGDFRRCKFPGQPLSGSQGGEGAHGGGGNPAAKQGVPRPPWLPDRSHNAGGWLDLIPHCDEVTKLHSFCSSCRASPAIFSHRVTGEVQQELITLKQLKYFMRV